MALFFPVVFHEHSFCFPNARSSPVCFLTVVLLPSFSPLFSFPFSYLSFAMSLRPSCHQPVTRGLVPPCCHRNPDGCSLATSSANNVHDSHINAPTNYSLRGCMEKADGLSSTRWQQKKRERKCLLTEGRRTCTPPMLALPSPHRVLCLVSSSFFFSSATI